MLACAACGNSSEVTPDAPGPGGTGQTLFEDRDCYYIYTDILGVDHEASSIEVHTVDDAGVYATCRSPGPPGNAPTTRLLRISSAGAATVLTSTTHQISDVVAVDGHILWTEYWNDREPEVTLHLLRAGASAPEAVTTPVGPNFHMTHQLATQPGSVWFAYSKLGHLDGDPPEDRALARLSIADGTFEIIPVPYEDAQSRYLSAPSELVADGEHVFWTRRAMTDDRLELVVTHRVTKEHRVLGEVTEPRESIPGGLFAYQGNLHVVDEDGCVARFDAQTGAGTTFGSCIGVVTEAIRDGSTLFATEYPGKKVLYSLSLDDTSTGFSKIADYGGCVVPSTQDASYCAGDRTVERWRRPF
jgi:hypothetical protein